jgi:hypothetical protein
VQSQSTGVAGSHHRGHEVGDNTGAQYSDLAEGGWDPLNGWLAPAFIGPYSNVQDVVWFRTKNKSGAGTLDHQFMPTDDVHGKLGAALYRWKELYVDQANMRWVALENLGAISFRNAANTAWADVISFGADNALRIRNTLTASTIHLAADMDVNSNLYIGYNAAGFIGIGLGTTKPKGIDVDVDVAGYVVLKCNGNNTLALGADIYIYKTLTPYGTVALGTSGAPFSAVYSNSLYISGNLVITSGNVLQNVTADAQIITSGRFSGSRLPTGSAGYVLMGNGSGDPYYSDPQGAFAPAAHTTMHDGRYSQLGHGHSEYALVGHGHSEYALVAAGWTYCNQQGCKNYEHV